VAFVRDLHLRHTLKLLAREASEKLDELLGDGQEIPYEIVEASDGSAFCQFRPLTARFVKDNAAELRGLESFREALAAMTAADAAGDYLHAAGITPPSDTDERSVLAITYFLARLWDSCSDFELDEDRFTSAIGEIEECSEPEPGQIEAIVPLVGFQMSVSRVDLSGAAIVRADVVDVPAEAARSERPSGAAWEPTFLLSALVDLDEDGGMSAAGDRVAATFERVITTLRLFKSGGVGLGPHGWVRIGGDRWRRISTGAGRPRPGGYRLADTELGELSDLSRSVAVHPRRMTRLRRSLLRFEAGLDRRGAVDALNDHLLALRFLLDGDNGPSAVGMPIRAATLAAAGEARAEAKATLERAIEIERSLWSGEPVGRDIGLSTSEVAVAVEGVLRTVIRRGISGELGSDLRVAADEILLAEGLAAGEGAISERGTSTEWDLPAIEAEQADEEIVVTAGTELMVDDDAEEAEMLEDETGGDELTWADSEMENEPSGEITVRRVGAEIEEEGVFDDEAAEEIVEAEPAILASEPLQPRGWLDEVPGSGETMDFPKRSSALEELSRPPMDREEVKARVEYLFPRTETDWVVGKSNQPQRASGPDQMSA